MPRPRRLHPLLLVLALFGAGCDPGVIAAPVEDIRYSTTDASTAGADAGQAIQDHDAGSTFSPDVGEPTAPGDAGVAPQSDAGGEAADGGSDGTDALGGCMAAQCGAEPPSSPTCFDGTSARIVCAPYVDGSCAWQFACGQ